VTQTFFTVGFDASAQIMNLRADMTKCLSANMSRHRFLYGKQLKKSRDLKGGFILDEEETKKMLTTQSILYPEIGGEKRFHPERLRPQMEAEVLKAKTPEGDRSPKTILSYYYHFIISGFHPFCRRRQKAFS
jgi:hypothetical protein